MMTALVTQLCQEKREKISTSFIRRMNLNYPTVESCECFWCSHNTYESERTPESGKDGGNHKQFYSRNVHVGDTQTFRFYLREYTNTHHLLLLRQSLFLPTITGAHKCAMWAKFNLFLKQVVHTVSTEFKGSRLIFFIPTFHITNKKECV